MLYELEQSTAFQEQMRRQQVVIASNRMDALEKGRALKVEGEMGIPADTASSTLRHMIDKWVGGIEHSWTVLQGKTVLDLASGSTLSRDAFTIWHPHFSRLCAVNGAEVIALDANAQVGVDQQLFKSAKVDLVEAILGNGLSQLDILSGRKFDIVHSTNFISFNPPPELVFQLIMLSVHLNEFERMFLEQAGELLAEGGAMCLDIRDEHWLPIVYTKKEGMLVEL